MEEKRAECLERITRDYGTQLRMNRSIQAEGSFANVKEDMNFRRYLYRGKENVLAQSILLAIGYDIIFECKYRMYTNVQCAFGNKMIQNVF